MSTRHTAKLGDLFDVSKGKVGIRAAVPGDVPLVTTGDTFLSHDEVHFDGDSVCIPLVSATGHGHASIRRLHHVRGRFAVGSILCACVTKDATQVLARYVYYYLTATKDSVLVPQMQGSANVSLKVADIEQIEIPLPSLTDQQAVVVRLDALAGKVQKLAAHLDAIDADADRLLAQQFQHTIAGATYRPMAEVAPAIRRTVELDSAKTYREVAARSFGKGLFAKPDFDAAQATWQKPVWVEAGDVIFSNIKAWEGAIALAGKQHHGCIASHRYITCLPESKALLAPFLLYFLLSEDGLERVGNASPGTADRNRTLSLRNLGKMKVPVPPLAAQQAFVTLLSTIAALKTRHAALREVSAALVPAALERVFARQFA